MKKLNNNEVKKAMLECLKKLASICEENNIEYYLYGGTLLGCVRDKGFIPWDDDIDVLMTRDNYETFIKYCIENEKKLYPFKIIHFSNADTTATIARFHNMKYKRVFLDNIRDCDQGIPVSIFPLDGGGDSIDECEKRMCRGKFIQNLIVISKYNSFVAPKNKLLIVPKFFIYHIAKKIGTRRMICYLDKYAKEKKYKESKYLGKIVWGKKHYALREELKTTKGLFEGIEFSIPSGYDKILTRMYGDYMTPVKFNGDAQLHNCEYYLRSDDK